tara:strand:- start:49716 stop:50186 length:471 start_codon:yes stop_codon:yes gene_type:complete
MWIVAKIKKNNQNLFVSEFKKKLTDVKFFYPKIFSKGKTKNILGNYIFCYHSNFNNKFQFQLKYLRGLITFLGNELTNQKDILKFIEYCKKHEDTNGCLKSSFFKENVFEKGKFINGPFSDYLFEVATREKNKLKIILGNFSATISDENNVLYQKI